MVRLSLDNVVERLRFPMDGRVDTGSGPGAGGEGRSVGSSRDARIVCCDVTRVVGEWDKFSLSAGAEDSPVYTVFALSSSLNGQLALALTSEHLTHLAAAYVVSTSPSCSKSVSDASTLCLIQLFIFSIHGLRSASFFFARPARPDSSRSRDVESPSTRAPRTSLGCDRQLGTYRSVRVSSQLTGHSIGLLSTLNT